MRLGPISLRRVFQERQGRLAEALRRRNVFEAAWASGFARAKNFAHNVYPFRAESHFLYLVGRHIEGALLSFREGVWTLFVQIPSPEAALWLGRQPSPAELENELEMRVRPIDEYEAGDELATLPPQDAETAEWLSSHAGRVIEAQSGPDIEGLDAELGDAMVEVRLLHDQAALAQLEFAAQVSAISHRVAMLLTPRVEYEFEIRAAMESEIRRHNLDTSYLPIVTVHGEIMHNTSSSGLLTEGDVLLCDVGAESAEGFAGDITRSIPVRGHFSGADREAYEAVLAVQKAVLLRVAPAVSFGELHYFSCLEMAKNLTSLGILRGHAEELVGSGALSTFYPHGLGHLLGLDVHDMEDLGDRAGYGAHVERRDHPAFRALRLNRVLEAGMAVTIEPGFYVSPLLLERAKQDPAISSFVDFNVVSRFERVRGIRIEDDVYVAPHGARILSASAPKEISDIDALMRA
jgi:Xaa-Pro aminopeptidase